MQWEHVGTVQLCLRFRGDGLRGVPAPRAGLCGRQGAAGGLGSGPGLLRRQLVLRPSRRPRLLQYEANANANAFHLFTFSNHGDVFPGLCSSSS